MPTHKLMFKLPMQHKLLPPLPLRRLSKRDKKLRMISMLLSNKELRMNRELPLLSKRHLKLPTLRLPLLIESRNSRLNLLLPRPDLKLTSRLLKLLLLLTPKSSRHKDSLMLLDSRLLLISKLLKSRLPKKLLKRPTRWPLLLERPKRRDKLPITPKRWPRESLNSENNSSMFGFLDQLVSPKSLSP